jgi:hypothetical protein
VPKAERADKETRREALEHGRRKESTGARGGRCRSGDEKDNARRVTCSQERWWGASLCVCVCVYVCACVRVFVWHRIGVAHAHTELVDIVLQNDAYSALCVVVHPCVMCCRSSYPPMVTTSALAHVLLDSSAASN